MFHSQLMNYFEVLRKKVGPAAFENGLRAGTDKLLLKEIEGATPLKSSNCKKKKKSSTQ